jgi:hypothetical protein
MGGFAFVVEIRPEQSKIRIVLCVLVDFIPFAIVPPDHYEIEGFEAADRPASKADSVNGAYSPAQPNAHTNLRQSIHLKSARSLERAEPKRFINFT